LKNSSLYFQHESAIIDEGAQIGAESKIWHFCHIMANAIIGEQCILGQNVFVANDVIIGNNVKIQNNVSIYKGVICEDDVFLGPSMVFTNVINPRSNIVRKEQFKKTIVRKGASIGANATIVCGVEIGSYAFVGAGAVITKNVPDYALVLGNPGNQSGWMSAFGEKLIFDENGHATCPGNGDKYVIKNDKVFKT
jgi:UDP-2-acetamido-3-amino-2,3-dideoxy-glucuronate N-acetyltransferase